MGLAMHTSSDLLMDLQLFVNLLVIHVNCSGFTFAPAHSAVAVSFCTVIPSLIAFAEQ